MVVVLRGVCVLNVLLMVFGVFSLKQCVFFCLLQFLMELILRYICFRRYWYIESEYYFLKELIEQRKIATQEEVVAMNFFICVHALRIIMCDEKLKSSRNILGKRYERLNQILACADKVLKTGEL